MQPFITKIKATGLKSGDFAHDLGRVTLFTGASFSGKTSRLDAIRLALHGATILGRANELKSTKAAILDLARNGSLDVSATDSLDRTNNRKWSKGPTVETCEIPETPAILLDSGLYFSLSDAKKIEYVFGLANIQDSEEFGPEAITAAVKNIKLEENTEATEAVVNDLVRIVNETDLERHDQGAPVQEWLAKLITSLKERLSLANAQAKRMTSTVQGITAMTAQAVQRRNPEQAIAEERKKAASLMVQKGEIAKSLEQIAKLEAKQADLKRQLAALPAETETTEAVDRSILGNDREIERLTAELAKLKADGVLQIDGMQKELDAVNAGMVVYVSKTNQLGNTRLNLRGNYNMAAHHLQLAAEEKANLVRLFAKSMEASSCPHCGSSDEHWTGDHSKAQLTKAHKVWLNNQASQVKEWEGDKAKAEAAIKALDAEIEKAEADDKSYEANRTAANNIQSRINSTRRILDQQVNTSEQEIAKSRQEIVRLQKRKEAIEKAGQSRTDIGRQIAETLEPIDERKRFETILAADTEALAKVQAEITTLEQQQREFIRSKADEARNAQALIEHAKAKADVDVTKAAIALLEDIQAKMVAAAFGTILTTVNRITSSVMSEPVEYANGELGRWVKTTWIKHECFSGTEKALTYAGISLALAAGAPIKIVLIDELGRLDLGSLSKLLERMKQLTASGELGQFVGAYSGGVPAMDGVEVICL